MGKSFLIVVDAHSKRAEVVEMAQTTTAQTIVVLRNSLAYMGCHNTWYLIMALN